MLLQACKGPTTTPIRKRCFSSAPEYDLIVIGAGPGGYVSAIRAAQLGLKTACVEKRQTLGGTCLNVGCIPSKALLHNSHMYHQAKHEFSSRGIDGSGGLEVNLKNMLAYKDKTVTQLTKGIEFLFKKNKVDWIKGSGKFVSPNTIEVSDNAGLPKTLRGKNILIATGSESVSPPGIQVDEKSIVSSTGALSLQQVPKRLLVVGGGIIGLELGSVWSRLGAQVTVVEYMDSIGAGMDGYVSSSFHKLLEKQGLSFKLGTKVTGADSAGPSGGWNVGLQSVKEGSKSETIQCDTVLVSVGRRPYTDGLGLTSSLGMKLDSKGRIETDANFKTSLPNVFAIGDVIAGPMLAHKAEEEGLAVVGSIVSSSSKGHPKEVTIPSVVYTHPEVAWAGKTEEQLKKDGTTYTSSIFPFLANSRAKTNGDLDGFVKVLVADDLLVGCHIIGPNGGEMIGEAVLAMQHGIKASDVASTCHAHPTLSEALKEACMGTVAPLKKPIHF